MTAGRAAALRAAGARLAAAGGGRRGAVAGALGFAALVGGVSVAVAAVAGAGPAVRRHSPRGGRRAPAESGAPAAGSAARVAREVRRRRSPATTGRARAWAELLRVSALFTVPGDALAGAAVAGRRPNRGTALAIGSSLCLYEAGMALNDYADRAVDAVERPERPIPSGRVKPGAALAAAAGLTAGGLALAAAAGRRPLAVATALAGAVWAYDLRLKSTPAAAAAMSAARALDLLLGATATTSRRPAGNGAGGPGVVPPAPGRARTGEPPLVAALVLGAHTYAVTAVSRREAQGGSTAAPLAALAATGAIAGAVGLRGTEPGPTPLAGLSGLTGPTAPAASYAATAARPYLHAALNPSPLLTQRAVGGGIRAMIPLQSALAARAGAPGTAAALLGLVPLARRLSRKVSPT